MRRLPWPGAHAAPVGQPVGPRPGVQLPGAELRGRAPLPPSLPSLLPPSSVPRSPSSLLPPPSSPRTVSSMSEAGPRLSGSCAQPSRMADPIPPPSQRERHAAGGATARRKRMLQGGPKLRVPQIPSRRRIINRLAILRRRELPRDAGGQLPRGDPARGRSAGSSARGRRGPWRGPCPRAGFGPPRLEGGGRPRSRRAASSSWPPPARLGWWPRGARGAAGEPDMRRPHFFNARSPEVPALSPGPVFHPEPFFFNGPGAR